MTTVKYHGEFPEGKDAITQHGVEFERGKSVNVTDKAVLAKLSTNRFFEVSGESDKEAIAQGVDEAEQAETATLRAYLQEQNVPAHHKLGLKSLRELKAAHEKAQAEAQEA